jgi:hypothetical protein
VRNTVYLADRGGKYVLGQIDDAIRLMWSRVRDDVSEADIRVNFTSEKCRTLLSMADPVRHELVFERDGERVWEGPITYKNMSQGSALLKARDPLFFTQRTVCKRKHSDRYKKGKKLRTVVERAEDIIRTEMPPLERAGANILDHIVTYKNANDAKTTRVTAAYSQYVWDDLEAMAARGGLDYTMVLRSLYLHDTHRFIGRGRTLTDSDFLGALSIITYGVELSIGSYATDNNGKKGFYIVDDDYYGPIELLASAYDLGETTDKVTVEELQDQALRNARKRYPAPTIILVPENVQVNPETVDELMPFFIPGVAFNVQTQVTGETYEAEMKFDGLRVEESSEGEKVFVRITNAPIGSEDDETGAGGEIG